MDQALQGGQVQRVFLLQIAGREVAILAVRLPGETVYVVAAGGMGAGVVTGAMAARLRSARTASLASQAHWRALLENARVFGADPNGLMVVRPAKGASDHEPLWHVETRGGALRLVQGAGPHSLRSVAELVLLADRGTRLSETLLEGGDEGRRTALGRALVKALARVTRRMQAIETDLEKMGEAQRRADLARLFVSEAAAAPRGRDRLVTTDWSTGEPRPIELPLDPAKSPQEQIAALFARARRMKAGARIAESRLAEAARTRARLEEIAALVGAETDLAILERDARLAAPRDFKALANVGGAHKTEAPRVPYRTFRSASGQTILVGKGAVDNDALTMRVARPRDLWLHAKNLTGAHVVVPMTAERSCPSDLLVDAAHLAAHFSSARDEGIVEVQYTPRRYVRKPRGAAPGAVSIDREKVLVLRRDDEALRRLLASES